MDRPLILIAKEGYTAAQVLASVNLLASNYWKSQGFTVDKGVVGKCKGVDNLDATRTTTWAKINTPPEGVEYFTSLSNDPRFPDWKEYWLEAGLPDCYEELELPEEWAPKEEEREYVKKWVSNTPSR